MNRTIVVPLDGSRLAEQALPEADRLAHEDQATLVLVRVAQSPFPHDVFATGVAVREAEQYLREVQQRQSEVGIVARTEVFVNDPAGAIARAAQVYDADVIVMSTHGRSGLGRVALGSVADKVLHEATIPVLLVRADRERETPSASPCGPYRKVLVPLDGTPPAEEALHVVTQHAALRNAAVVLVHSVQTAMRPVLGDAWGYTLPQVIAEADAEAQRRCQEMRVYLDELALRELSGHITHTDVTIGEPGESILRLAQEQDVDLIVIATHARHGLADVTHGSVARHVLHHAPAPVLVLRRSDATIAAPLSVQPQLTGTIVR